MSLLIALSIVLLHLISPRSYSQRQLPGLFFLVAWAAWGSINTGLKAGRTEAEVLEQKPIETPCQVKVLEYLGKSGGDIRYRGTLEGAGLAVLLRIKEKGDPGDALLPGDKLICGTSPERISSSQGPAEFDRQTFYQKRGIFHELSLSVEDYRKRSSSMDGWMTDPWTQALRLREQLYRSLRKKTPLNGSELAVASALWLGRKSDMPDSLRSDYANAGGMHVLAVSGLHVGIVYLMLLWISIPFRWNDGSKRLRPFLIVLLLWAYALLTGWSASVVRAVLMFSLYTLGQSLERPPTVGNTIAGSALLVLLFDPLMIRDIGFLLSYSAVIAIITLYPRIESLYRPRWPPLQWLWSLLAVSAAAQIGVLPIVLFVFGKFPLWFGITNPLLLPMATLTLYSGFLTGISFLFPAGPEWIGGFAYLLLKGMNAWVGWIAEWPGAGYKIGPIGFLTCLLLSACLACFILWLYRKTSHLFLQTTVLVFLLFLLGQEKMIERTSVLIQHAGKEPPVTAFRRGEKVMLCSPSPLRKYRKSKLVSYWKERGVEKVNTVLFASNSEMSAVLETKSISIFYWKGSGALGTEASSLLKNKKQVLFLIGRGATDFKKIPEIFTKAEHWVLLKEEGKKKWQKEAQKRGVKLHVLPEDGAYIAQL